MQITTSADALARATYNALLYCPKTPPWDACLIVLTPEGVSYLTSDSYSLAWSTCPAELDGAVTWSAIKIAREDLAALEKRAREGKKETVRLDFEPGELFAYRGENPDEDIELADLFEDSDIPDEEDSRDENILAVFRELISERETDPSTRRVMVATDYVRKLGQLKKGKHQGADFCFGEEDDPVLVKVGEGFRLIVEPIDRERHRLALGEGATW